ncbi:response regulator [uncultured Nostoc sp.]|uniref:response regulator n=1 Tax=uncultured Nostoc sp. TaxID=340711 RepID=UPI0035CB5F7E
MPKEEGGEIPAIALTAYARESDRDQVLAARFQKHVAKPVQPTELLTSIADLLVQKYN